MRGRRLLLVAGSLIVVGRLAAQDADIARYYQDEKAVPPFAQAIQDLAQDRDPAKRDAAGHYLTALCTRLLADERAGRSPTHTLPFWGSSPEVVARDLRSRVAAELGKGSQGDAALEVAAWLLNEEFDADNAWVGFQIVERTPGPRADELLRALLARPHSVGKILVAAIKESAKRRLAVAPEIARLGNSPRASVRQAARAVATGSVPPFRPAEALTPELEKLLRDWAAMVMDEIPSDASWVRVHAVAVGDSSYERAIDFNGWPLGPTPDGRRVFLDYFARNLVLDERDPAKPTLEVLDQFAWDSAREGQPLKPGSVTVEPASFAEDARRFQAIRNVPKTDSKFREKRGALSVRGSLTGQFEPGFIALPEVLVAAWAFGRGEGDVAADILLPRLDAADDDRWLPEAARNYLGHRYHQAMLVAFSARDYPKAARLARHLAQPVFDGYGYQQRARELAAQIDRRGDDFKTFKLPTPADWQTIRDGLDRPAQVRYLAERLRLLNCMQYGQPSSGIDYAQRQFADTSPATATKASVRVINPYKELSAMRLAPDDLIGLIPFLTDADYLPTISFWRDFNPDWNLHYVGMTVCPLVNAAAHRTLADLDKFGRLDEAGRKTYLDGLLDWCRANRGKSADDLMLGTIRAAHNWTEVEPEAKLAVEVKSAAALPALAARIKDFDQYRAGDIAHDCFLIGTPALLPLAHGWLDDKDQPKEVRCWAALGLVRDGNEAERREGLAALAPLLAHDDSYYYERVFDTLLDSQDEAAVRLACDGLTKKFTFRSTAEGMVRKLFMRGRPEALDYLVRQLGSEQNAGTTSVVRLGKSVLEPITEADSIAQYTTNWRTDGYQFSYDTPQAERRRQERELVDWFKAQFERIKTGQKTDLRGFEPVSADEDEP